MLLLQYSLDIRMHLQVANEGRKEAHSYKSLYGDVIPVKVLFAAPVSFSIHRSNVNQRCSETSTFLNISEDVIGVMCMHRFWTRNCQAFFTSTAWAIWGVPLVRGMISIIDLTVIVQTVRSVVKYHVCGHWQSIYWSVPLWSSFDAISHFLRTFMAILSIYIHYFLLSGISQSVLLGSWDEQSGPGLYMIDPSGSSWVRSLYLPLVFHSSP